MYVDTMSGGRYNKTENPDKPRKRSASIMPKGSPELTRARKEEIINARAKLYETMNFKDVTLKETGKKTSFSRTLYNFPMRWPILWRDETVC